MLNKQGLKYRRIIGFLIICASLILSKESKSQGFSELLNKILLQDESINSSKTLIQKNKNDLSSAWSSYTPKLNFTVPVGREVLINNDNANTDMDYYELDARVSQNIYDFGLTSSKIEIAKNTLELSKISNTNVKSNKILEALAAYLNYIKTFNVLIFAKESESRIKTVTRLENEKVARGAGLASNVLQSKARLAGARSTRVKFEGDLAIAKNRFFNVFRENPTDFSSFKEPTLPINLLPRSEEEAIKIARENNIALKISNLSLKNAKSKVKGSKAKFLPSLKAIAQYKNKRNVSGLKGTEIDHIYKIEMNYPISIGGPLGFFYKENADYKSSMNQYMMTKYGHDQLKRNLEESVRNSWQTKSIAKQNYEYLENQANISGEFFDLAMKEVKLGNRQLIDILSSETAFINSKSAAENAKTQYKLAVYQLLFAVGILDENIFRNYDDTIKKKSSLKNKDNKFDKIEDIEDKIKIHNSQAVTIINEPVSKKIILKNKKDNIIKTKNNTPNLKKNDDNKPTYLVKNKKIILNNEINKSEPVLKKKVSNIIVDTNKIKLISKSEKKLEGNSFYKVHKAQALACGAYNYKSVSILHSEWLIVEPHHGENAKSSNSSSLRFPF